MKAIKKILIVLAIIGIIIISVMEILCRFGIECKNCEKISIDKEASIKDGFCLSEYDTKTKKLTNKYRRIT